MFSGVGGNDNNFDSLKECFKTCKPNTCKLTVDLGDETHTCGGTAGLRYYYDGRDGQCKRFRYTGCGGNSNNFATSLECLHICGGEEEPCELGIDAGPCDGAFPRYGYDASVGRCVRFMYGVSELVTCTFP